MRALLLVGVMLALLSVAAGLSFADNGDKVLYSFETGTDGWWTFANGATLKLSGDSTTGANASSGSLLASYQWQPGAGAYMGLGVQPKWAMAGDSWPPYAKGHFAVSFKSDVPITLHIELRASDKKAYSFAIANVPTKWTDYTIPFDKFVSDGKSINLTAVDIDQMVVIPAKVDDAAHTLWMDNVTISKTPTKP